MKPAKEAFDPLNMLETIGRLERDRAELIEALRDIVSVHPMNVACFNARMRARDILERLENNK